MHASPLLVQFTVPKYSNIIRFKSQHNIQYPLSQSTIMARRSKQNSFLEIDPNHEDEILEIYAIMTEESPDLYLRQLPAIFRKLRIPKCFVTDIIACIAYYYELMDGRKVAYNPANRKQAMTMRLLLAYTLTAPNADIENILDILDVDKLIRNVDRLLKYRDNYAHVMATWKLCVEATTTDSSKMKKYTDAELASFKLDLTLLKKIKTHLDLDASDARRGMSDALLIDMLSCCAFNERDEPVNYAFDSNVTHINFKVFADILGHLGELV